MIARADLPELAEESAAMRSGSGEREGVLGSGGIDGGSAELEDGATVSSLLRKLPC